MRRVTVRIPDDLLRAYDMAEGNRSELIRRILLDAVADGEVSGVPPDIRKLAERERAVNSGRLARKQATYKSRLLEFYREKWEDGAVTPTDAATLAASWRAEARLYDDDREGTPHEDLLDALLDWYRANWSRTAAERPAWPDAGRLLRAAGIGEGDDAAIGTDPDLIDEIADYGERDTDAEAVLSDLTDREGVTPTDALAAIRESDAYDTEAIDGGE